MKRRGILLAATAVAVVAGATLGGLSGAARSAPLDQERIALRRHARSCSTRARSGRGTR